MTLEELQQIIFDAGIVGAGGAGFPTHKKLASGIKQIVINAAECEPLMMVDHHIFRKHLRAIIETIKTLHKWNNQGFFVKTILSEHQ